MDVKERIRQLMGEQHLTQKELAERSGVGAVTISRILNGHFEPQAATLAKLADAFGKSVSEMIQDDLYDTNKRKTIYGYIEYMGIIHRINGFKSLESFYTKVKDNLKTKDNMNKIGIKAEQDKQLHLSKEGNVRGIIGAVIGDVVGSRFEFLKRIPKEYDLFAEKCTFTDDSVLTVAIADSLLHSRDFKVSISDWVKRYPNAGFGVRFRKLMRGVKDVSNDSIGNGSGMRVSPIGFFAETLDDTLELAKQSAVVSHNSKEGIKGAQSIAAATFLAKQQKPKDEIKAYIENEFGYNLHLTEEEIKERVAIVNQENKNEWAENTCPLAIIAFLMTDDYEGAIRKAISYNCDTDTVACMAGGIAAAYYGVPQEIVNNVVNYLQQDLIDVINEFDGLNLQITERITPKEFHRWGGYLVYGTGENKNNETEGYMAMKNFRATNVLEGIDHNAYAIPTVGRSLDEIKAAVDRFIDYAEGHKDKTFLVTQVGCSKAGYTPKQIAPMFEKAKNMTNVYLPLVFKEIPETWEKIKRTKG
jgi:ADP-ribosylglycohydrolase/DNA-binding XRE family transcriptional regulator